MKSKNLVSIFLFTLIYLVMIFAVGCTGMIHPLFWAYFSVTAALITWFPYVNLMNRVKGFGAAAVPCAVLLLLSLIAGEADKQSAIIIIVVAVAAELVSFITGFHSKKAYILSYGIFALVPMAYTLRLWTDRAFCFANASTEMGIKYAKTLSEVTPDWSLAAAIIATLVAAIAIAHATLKKLQS